MRDAGDDVKLIFDGGGTAWPGELANDDHPGRSHVLTPAQQGPPGSGASGDSL